jgi:dTDP-4-amino-4,6-dideoxygalactose transaminase
MMTETRRIPFFNYPALFARDEAQIMETVRDVGSRGAYIMQRDLAEFENKLAEFVGAKYAFGVSDGSNAITIALIAAGVRPEDEVILPSHTFIATAAAVHAAGAVPVLADCNTDHMLSTDSVRGLITRMSTAVLPVQLNGRTCDMEAVQNVADEHGLLVIEDAAQALGSKFRGRCAGTFGQAGTFSFYPAKLLGCLGDGGGLVTNDDEVADQVHMLRDHGRDRDGEIRRWGFNSRLDNLQAAILNFKLERFPGEVARRRQIAARYEELLGGLDTLLLPPPPSDGDHFDVYQNYEIEATDRDGLQSHLGELGVGTLVQWGGTPVHGFKELGFDQTPAYTEAMFSRCLMLPMNTSLTDDDVDFVASSVQSYYDA